MVALNASSGKQGGGVTPAGAASVASTPLPRIWFRHGNYPSAHGPLETLVQWVWHAEGAGTLRNVGTRQKGGPREAAARGAEGGPCAGN